MSLLKLKDAVVEDIQDESVDYDVFGGTFSDSDKVTTTSFTIDLEDGRTIKLEGFLESCYDSPTGFANYGGLIVDLMRKVFNKETEEMTVVDLIKWVFNDYADGNIKISVENLLSGNIKYGLLKNHSKRYLSSTSYLDWSKHIAGPILNRADFFKDNAVEEINKLERTKPDVYTFNIGTLEFAGLTLEDFLTV